MPNDPASQEVDLSALSAARSLADPGVLPLALQALRQLGKDAPPFDRSRLDTLLAVDERCEELLLEDGADVLARTSAGGALRDADVSFAQLIQRLHAEAAIGLQRFLRNRDRWAAGAPADLVNVLAHALNAMHGFAKWGYFLGRAGSGVPWKQLHGLYFLSESQGVAASRVELQPWSPQYRPSAQALYIRTLMLDMLHGCGLTPPQLEIADAWCGDWSVDFRLDTGYRARDHLFCVDLAGERALEVVRPDQSGDGIRYLRTDGLGERLEGVRAVMQSGRLHGPLGAAARLRVEDHLAVLNLLERFLPSLTANVENRLSERQAAGGVEPRLVWSLPAAVEAVAATGSGHLPGAGTGWRLYNRAPRNFGLVSEQPEASAARPGSLVGMFDDERQAWVIGSVVHCTRFGPGGATLVGVEVIATQTCGATLEREGSPPSSVILSTGADPGGRFDALLLSDGEYVNGSLALLSVADVSFRIRIGHAASRGPGWVKARFVVEPRER